jgi:hypothetical protein
LSIQESGIGAIAGRLQIDGDSTEMQLLKALDLQHQGKTVEAQSTVDKILADMRFPPEPLVIALLEDVEESGLRVHSPPEANFNVRQ